MALLSNEYNSTKTLIWNHTSPLVRFDHVIFLWGKISAIIIHQFSTHRYSVGVAVSYSWNFLICINICKTIESSSLLCAVDLQSLPAYRKLFSFRFTILKQFLARFFNLFYRFGLIVCYYYCIFVQKLIAELRKSEGNLG